METWKDIKGYEGLYQVSTMGRVKSLKRTRKTNGKNAVVRERILTPYTNPYGYVNYYLRREGEKKGYRINRLVAQTFIPNPNNLPYVNHKDENKLNNCVDNLEWCTALYNNNYGTRNKRISDTKNEKCNHR